VQTNSKQVYKYQIQPNNSLKNTTSVGHPPAKAEEDKMASVKRFLDIKSRGGMG
jgi:hypothetical protein